MKKAFAFLILLAAALAPCCDKEENAGEILRLTVASERTYMTEPTGNMDILVYLVRYPSQTKWSTFSTPIRGFDELYRTGYEYVIEIEAVGVKNPPQDASSVDYRMIRLISRIEKQSEDLPEDSVKE